MSPAGRPSGASEGPRYRYYVLLLLTLTSMLSVADRLVFSILMQDIKTEFRLSDSQLGLLAGAAFTLTYIAFGFPVARVADRSNRKTMVAVAVTVWSTMTALCGLATGYWSLFLARIGVGMGEAGSGPPGQSLLADYFRRSELARAMGFLTLGATIGTALGLMAGGLLAEAFGWRMAFILFGLPGLALGAVVYLTVREPVRGRYAPAGASATQLPLGQTIRSLLGNRVFTGLVMGFALQIMIGYAMAIWMPAVMLRNFDVSTGDVAVYLGCTYLLGGIPGPIIGGYLTDWLTQRDERWRAWLPGIVSMLCLIPLWLSLNATSFWPFLGFFALSYGIFVSSQAPILSLLQASVEPSQRGFAVAFALFFNNMIGQMVGAALIGLLSDRFRPAYGAYGLNLAVLGVCIAAGALAMVVFAWTAAQMGRSGYLAKLAAE